MPTPFQKTLYRSENETWHYIRLIWQETNQWFEVRTAPCGHVATPIRQETLLPGETKETALHRLVTDLRQTGYLEHPTEYQPLDVQIFTPARDGFPAAAPWFDALQLELVPLLYKGLQDQANGANIGGIQTAAGCITHFLGVLNAPAALETIAAISQQPPALFRIQANVRQKIVAPAPVNLPEKTIETAEALKLGSHLADVMSNILEDLQQKIKPFLQSEPAAGITYPDRVSAESIEPDRVYGEKADRLRERVREQWGVGTGYYWPPLDQSAPGETLHVEGLDEETAAQLIAIIQPRIIGQLYAFDAGEGIFTAEPERLLSRFMIDDTYWFDDGLEWLVYASHHDTVTFGG
ncbi:MAG: hypothetical protein ABIQ93_04950, partial [Saprospiraceae bacterium]